jgi:hypothetical protein
MKIPVSKTYALVDDEFAYLADLIWHLDSDGYAINFKTKTRMHKMIMKGEEIDHINGNRLDNRRSNLRVITHKENVQNGSAHKDSTSKYKGVSKHKQWRVQLCHEGRKMLIGEFPTEKIAATAYDLWAKPLGRKTNFSVYSNG